MIYEQRDYYESSISNSNSSCSYLYNRNISSSSNIIIICTTTTKPDMFLIQTTMHPVHKRELYLLLKYRCQYYNHNHQLH